MSTADAFNAMFWWIGSLTFTALVATLAIIVVTLGLSLLVASMLALATKLGILK